LFAGYSGMLAFAVDEGGEGARVLVKSLQITTHSASLGGTETLVTIPARTSHAPLSSEERRQVGISDGLIRVSVGVEHIDDLIRDFDGALSAAEEATRG
jgi:cystathionine beta-lyase/cystathionine gamma-synthase